MATSHSKSGGVITVPAGQAMLIDGPTSIAHLVVGSGARVEAQSLVGVSGWIIVVNGAVLIAPNLKTCNMLDIGIGAQVTAPELRRAERVSVGAGYNRDTLLLPSALSSSETTMLIEPMFGSAFATGRSASLEARSLEMVTNAITMGSDSSLVAPSLRRYGGIESGGHFYSCSKLPVGVRIEAPCASAR